MRYIKGMIALLLIAVICLPCVASLAEEQVTTTGSVYLRKGPGLSYKSICTIGEGTRLTYDRSEKDDRGVAWYRVTYNGRQGWVSSTYAKPGGASTDDKVKTTGNVHLRSGPGAEYASRAIIDAGTTLVCDKTEKDSEGTAWYRVSYRGKTGWISSRYAKRGSGASSGQITTTGNVHLRSGAGLDYASYGTIGTGTTLNYDQTAKDSRGVVWYHVSYKGQKGWVSSMYARQGGGSAPKNNVVTTTGKVHLRTGAGLSYKSICTVGADVTLTYDDAAKDNRGVAWYHVSYAGKKGWISAKYAAKGSSGSSAGEKVKITSSVNVRSGPGLDYASIGTVDSGTSLTYRGKAQKDDRGVAWYAVSYKGKNGWVSSKYAKIK